MGATQSSQNPQEWNSGKQWSNNPISSSTTKFVKLEDAIRHGTIYDVKELIEKGADVNEKIKDFILNGTVMGKNVPLLLVAGILEKYDIVKLLVESGANANSQDNFGNNILTILLIVNSQNPINNLSELFDFLIQKGADVNIGSCNFFIDKKETFNKKDLKFLFSKGFNPNSLCKNGNTSSIHAAVNREDNEFIKELIDNGANINLKTVSGITPLMVAVIYDKIDTVKFLIDNGADIDSKDKNLNTPLILAAEDDNFDIVKFLIEHNANINSKNIELRSALIFAAANGRFDTVKILVENGANVNIRDKYGKTAYDYADDNDVKKYLAFKSIKFVSGPPTPAAAGKRRKTYRKRVKKSKKTRKH